MMMVMMSTFIAHDSINLNAQCTERGREGSREKVIISSSFLNAHGAKSFTEHSCSQVIAQLLQCCIKSMLGWH